MLAPLVLLDSSGVRRSPIRSCCGGRPPRDDGTTRRTHDPCSLLRLPPTAIISVSLSVCCSVYYCTSRASAQCVLMLAHQMSAGDGPFEDFHLSVHKTITTTNCMCFREDDISPMCTAFFSPCVGIYNHHNLSNDKSTIMMIMVGRAEGKGAGSIMNIHSPARESLHSAIG